MCKDLKSLCCQGFYPGSRSSSASLTLPSPVILAPMSGVTDAPFRRLAAGLGAGLVVSEMTASEALAEGCADALLRAEGRGLDTHVVQLAGCEARWMGEAARIAEASGAAHHRYQHGLPGAARHRRAIGLRADARSRPRHDVDRGDRRRGSVPVTLKMRLGWDERSINAPELARRAQDAGVRLITVHGRTRCQFYKGRADWDAVRAVKDERLDSARRERRHPYLRGRAAALAASGADAVMVGRAAQGPPVAARVRSVAAWPAAGARARRRSPRNSRSSASSTTICCRTTAARSAGAMRASISAGRSTRRPRRRVRPRACSRHIASGC